MRNDAGARGFLPFYCPGFYLIGHAEHFDVDALQHKYRVGGLQAVISAMKKDHSWDQVLVGFLTKSTVAQSRHRQLMEKIQHEGLEFALLDLTPNLSLHWLERYFNQDEEAMSYLSSYCNDRAAIAKSDLDMLSRADLGQTALKATFQAITDNIDSIVEQHPKLWPYVLMQIASMDQTLTNTSFRMTFWMNDGRLCSQAPLRQLRFIPWIEKANMGAIKTLAVLMVDGSFIEHELMIDGVMSAVSGCRDNWVLRLQFATLVRTEVQVQIMNRLEAAEKFSLEQAKQAEIDHLKVFCESHREYSQLLNGFSTKFREYINKMPKGSAVDCVAAIDEIESALLVLKQDFEQQPMPSFVLQPCTYRVYLKLQNLFAKVCKDCLRQVDSRDRLLKAWQGWCRFTTERLVDNRYITSVFEEDQQAVLARVEPIYHFCMMQSQQFGQMHFQHYPQWLERHMSTDSLREFYKGKRADWRLEIEYLQKRFSGVQHHQWLSFLRVLQMTPAFILQESLSKKIAIPIEMLKVINRMPVSAYYYAKNAFCGWRKSAAEIAEGIVRDYLTTRGLLADYATLPEGIKLMIVAQYGCAYRYFLHEMTNELEYCPDRVRYQSAGALDLGEVIKIIKGCEVPYNRAEQAGVIEQQVILEEGYLDDLNALYQTASIQPPGVCNELSSGKVSVGNGPHEMMQMALNYLRAPGRQSAGRHHELPSSPEGESDLREQYKAENFPPLHPF